MFRLGVVCLSSLLLWCFLLQICFDFLGWFKCYVFVFGLVTLFYFGVTFAGGYCFVLGLDLAFFWCVGV